MCIIAVRENLPLHNNYQKAKGDFSVSAYIAPEKRSDSTSSSFSVLRKPMDFAKKHYTFPMKAAIFSASFMPLSYIFCNFSWLLLSVDSPQISSGATMSSLPIF